MFAGRSSCSSWTWRPQALTLHLIKSWSSRVAMLPQTHVPAGRRFPRWFARALKTRRFTCTVTNNKLKARGWQGRVYCSLPAPAAQIRVHSFFSSKRFALSTVFLTNGSHFACPVLFAVCISAERSTLYVSFPMNGSGFLLCAGEVSLKACPLNGIHFRPHF